MRPRVGVLTLGGTISMTRSAAGGVAPHLGAAEILAAAPEICGIAEVRAEALAEAPSVELGFADIARVAERARALVADGAAGVVVVQGTDVLEECAYALDLLLDLDAPVVVTGAMRGPSCAGPDGPANLTAAVRVAAAPAARGLGVLVAMDDQVHAARWARKQHTHRPSAFASPGAGPLGWVAEGQVAIAMRPAARSPTIEWRGRAGDVVLLPTPFGTGLRALEGLLLVPPDGLVVEAVGGGHVPARLAGPLGRIAQTMPVVLASRAGEGTVLQATYGYPGGEIDLFGRGLLSAGSLDARKARVLLALALGARTEAAGLRRLLGAS